MSRTTIAEQSIIATKAKQGIATEPTIESVPAVGTGERIITRSAVEYANPVITSIAEVRDINCAGTTGKTQCVVTTKTRHSKLLDHG